MSNDGKELRLEELDLVTGGYLNFPRNENGQYICPSCGGGIDNESLICTGCQASYGKSTPGEMRMYE